MYSSTLFIGLAGLFTVAKGVMGAYSCDPSTCRAPTCFCASPNPPGGLAASDVPQFVTVTFDDAVQAYTFPAAHALIGKHQNPNGCSARGTFFVSINYTDYHLVTQLYSSGHEIADHTFTHPNLPSPQEVTSCKTALNAYAGVPRGRITGFRFPFLKYAPESMVMLGALGFEYESSVTATKDTAFWPYTLDNGFANDCYQPGLCVDAGGPKIPGMFEIPMHAVHDAASAPHLMDPYLEGKPQDVADWLRLNFDRHYTGGRAPFGLYVHPAHLSTSPGLPSPQAMLDLLNAFLVYASSQQDVWFVTNQQLLAWMRNPVPKSQMTSHPAFMCQKPDLKAEICNGLYDLETTPNEALGKADGALAERCNFPEGGFSTCYGCPSKPPTLEEPTPPPAQANGTAGARCHVPDTCDTRWWDPVACKCLCESDSCKWTDSSRPLDSLRAASAPGRTSDAAPLPTGQGSALAILLSTFAIGFLQG